jgi:hypothetical protein
MEVCVVCLETVGNQRYIFSSNRLRENVGASEIVHSLGHGVLDAALRHVFGKATGALRQPIEKSDTAAEVVVAASGTALVLVRERERGVELVRAVDTVMLRSRPGCDVCGVVGDPVEWETASLAEANRQAHEALDTVRAGLAGRAGRWLRLPVVASCASSGDSAAALDPYPPGGEEPEPLSEASLAKRRAVRRFLRRLAREFPQAHFAGDINLLEAMLLDRDRRWLGVLHADGNGLGEMVQQFPKRMGLERAAENRSYLNMYRCFSEDLDACAQEALRGALTRVETLAEGTFPVIPLVVGGDDLTLLVDGAQALDLAAAYLEGFEDLSARSDFRTGALADVAGATGGIPRLAVCAGVALIKPHFPFHVAYGLAEELLHSAKQVKRAICSAPGQPYPCSALDFQVVWDASPGSVDTMRAGWAVDGVRRSARPYVVTPLARLQHAQDAGRQWAARRHWTVLRRSIQALRTRVDGGNERLLPASPLHAVRAALFDDAEEAARRWRRLWPAAEADAVAERRRAALRDVAGGGEGAASPPELWWSDPDPWEGGGSWRCTGLLDAMEAAAVTAAADAHVAGVGA